MLHLPCICTVITHEIQFSGQDRFHLEHRLILGYDISNQLALTCDGPLILGCQSYEPSVIQVSLKIARGFPAIVLLLWSWLMTAVFLNAPCAHYAQFHLTQTCMWIRVHHIGEFLWNCPLIDFLQNLVIVLPLFGSNWYEKNWRIQGIMESQNVSTFAFWWRGDILYNKWWQEFDLCHSSWLNCGSKVSVSGLNLQLKLQNSLS